MHHALVKPKQTNRILIVGKSGSGKTTLARQLIEALLPAHQYVVIVNAKRELAEYCQKAYVVDDQGNPEAAFRAGHRRIFFQVTGLKPQPFLNALGLAIMRRPRVLLVVDEAHQFFARGKTPPALFRVLTAGRDMGHNCLFITQQLKAAEGAIDLGVMNQASHLVAFQLVGEGDVARFTAFVPEWGERIKTLARPDGSGPPEYVVKNLDNGNVGVVQRSPNGRIWRHIA